MPAIERVRQLKGMLLDLLFPPRCVGCGREGSFLCITCYDALPCLAAPLCELCGLPLKGGGLCPACARESQAVDRIRSPLLYQGLAREVVHSLKYRNLRSLAAPLGQLLAEYLVQQALPGDVLVPVPLHPSRLRQRGYNQATLLARELGERSGLPVVDDCLVRLTNAPAQARSSSATERQRNVKDAFACRDNTLRGRQVLLIDDVCTTGATLNECALALKAKGAAVVSGLTLAREV